MITIIWNDLAVRDYHDYLVSKWSNVEAITFMNQVDSIISNLKQGSTEFKKTGYQDIRQCVVCKQITLYYKLNGSDVIELLRFWNNTKDSSFLK